MGAFLTIGYCSRTIVFHVVFWKFLWGDKALMEGFKVTMGDPPTREDPGLSLKLICQVRNKNMECRLVLLHMTHFALPL